jgi:hypothetical protein
LLSNLPTTAPASWETAIYTLLRNGLTRESFRSQVPSLAATIVVAESFYKFHSFTLEFLAALATWLVIDFVLLTLLAGITAGARALYGEPPAKQRSGLDGDA